MMNKKRTSQVGWGKYLLTLPLFAVLLMVSYACKNKTSTDTNVQNKVVAEAVDTVVTTATVTVPPPPLKTTVKFTAPAHVKEAKSANQKHQVFKSTVRFIAPVINDSVYYGVDQMPQYPGGDEELLKFIKDNLRYPEVAASAGIEGRVTIRFIVNRNGDVTDLTVIRGLDASCNKEAVRVVKLMPRWIPGRKNSQNVPVYYTLPIVYKLAKYSPIFPS